MSTALAVRLAMGQESLLGDGDELAENAGGTRHYQPPSLDDLIVDTWEELARGTSQCPVCGGRMEPEYGAHTRPVGGRCADCGSALH
jgi:tRNA(Ile2) C34 agmatinyltransferase TiaS